MSYKPNLALEIKARMPPSTQIMDSLSTLFPGAQKAMWQRRLKDCKRQRKKKLAVRVCLLEVTGKLHPGHLSNMAAKRRPEQETLIDTLPKKDCIGLPQI